MRRGATASEFSTAVLAEFVRLGVQHAVVCPGSRSQALALAAVTCEDAGLLSLSVRIDERGAGFLALGLAVESGMPTLVITTSGTAVGNLLPAVLEAHHSGVPMILLTADRPEELRGIGANQATAQSGIFGDFVRLFREIEPPDESAKDPAQPAELARDAVSTAIGHASAPGPVHLNMAFREPLSGGMTLSALAGVAPAETPPTRRVSSAIELVPEPFTIVVAGHAAGEQAEEAARALGAPLLAEVTSGAHFGPNLVVTYRELLHMPEFGGRVQRVIVFGHPTLSREVPVLIERAEVSTIVVRGDAVEDYNPGHRVHTFADAVRISETTEVADESWLGSWVSASRALLDDAARISHPAETVSARTDDRKAVAEFAKAQLAVFREPVTRRMLVETVWQKTWPHDRLVFGSSRLIREADRVVTGKRLRVHSNRGLAGIDGTVATAIGIALGSQFGPQRGNAPAGTTRLVVGDLALLHDAGSMLTVPGEPEPRIQVIVGNDGGGTIFDSLEVAATADTAAFDRVMYTPHSVRLEALAEAYGWNYLLVTNRGELDEAIGLAEGRTIIEVPLPR